MRRTALLVTVLTAFAVGLVGCSSETPGDALPGTTESGGGNFPSFSDDPPTDEPTGDPSTDPSTDEPGSGTADLSPCSLLQPEELAALQVPPDGSEKEVGQSRRCQWQASGSHSVTVGILDEAGIDEVVSSGEKKPVHVGSSDAIQYTVGSGTCGIAIEVTDSSRVDVLGGAGGDLNRACQIANQAAVLVEPKL